MDNSYKLRYLDFIETDEYIWFPNLYFNALIKIDKNSGKIQIIDKFPNYKENEQWLYTAICKIGERLIFTPHGSREIVSYNIETGKFTSIALNLNIVGKRWGYFISAYSYKKFVYMFPTYTRCIVRFDTQNDSIAYLDVGLSKALKNLPETAACFIKEFEIIGHKIYIPFAMINAIAIFDLEEEQLEIKYLNITGGCSTINYIDGFFYLASCNDYRIYSWNKNTDEIIVYKDFPNEFMSKNYMFSCSCMIKNKIIFMPLESNMIISMNLKTKKISCEKKIISANREWWYTYFLKRKNSKIFLMTADFRMMCLLEYENESLRYLPYCNYDDLFNERKIKNFFIENMLFNTLRESEIELEDYIKFLAQSNILLSDHEVKEIGNNIFGKVRKNV